MDQVLLDLPLLFVVYEWGHFKASCHFSSFPTQLCYSDSDIQHLDYKMREKNDRVMQREMARIPEAFV